MNIEEKFKRYLELSVEFEKSEIRIFEEEDTILKSDSDIYDLNNISGKFVAYTDSNIKEEETSRLEQYKNQFKEIKNKVKRYEEYKELQTLLREYFNATEKLNK